MKTQQDIIEFYKDFIDGLRYLQFIEDCQMGFNKWSKTGKSYLIKSQTEFAISNEYRLPNILILTVI